MIVFRKALKLHFLSKLVGMSGNWLKNMNQETEECKRMWTDIDYHLGFIVAIINAKKINGKVNKD